MRIDKALKKAVERKDTAGDFGQQLKENFDFRRRMEAAGVITRKQSFSIPLMERITRAAD